MTPQEYIASGILETYALGAASPAEQQEVERMASMHAEVRKALDEILAGIESYATLHAVEPDEALREKIISGITAVKTGNGVAQNGKVIPLQKSASPLWKNAAIAASLMLVLSIGYNIFQLMNAGEMRSDNRHLSERLSSVEDSAKKQSLLAQHIAAERDSVLHDLAFLRSPMTKSITLNSMLAGHPMKAMVHWDMNTMKVAVDPMTLPATAADKKYVLWAIVGGKPVNEGGFSVSDSTGIMMMKVVPDAQAFAITLESSGDVPAPEGQMYVMGQSSPSQP